MNETSERLRSWLAGAEQKRAEACLKWLRGHLAIGLFDGSWPLHDSIEQDPAVYLRLLTDNPAMCKAVERAAGSTRTAMDAGRLQADILRGRNIDPKATRIKAEVKNGENGRPPFDVK